MSLTNSVKTECKKATLRNLTAAGTPMASDDVVMVRDECISSYLTFQIEVIALMRRHIATTIATLASLIAQCFTTLVHLQGQPLSAHEPFRIRRDRAPFILSKDAHRDGIQAVAYGAGATKALLVLITKINALRKRGNDAASTWCCRRGSLWTLAACSRAAWPCWPIPATEKPKFMIVPWYSLRSCRVWVTIVLGNSRLPQ